MTLVAGATIGPYRIIEQVGRGGMATVYTAYQAALARNVAIKVLPAFFAEDPGFRERFQQEAIAVAKLRHPNILAVFDYGEENGVTYIVSEFVDGGTLAEQLGTPLPADYAVRILGPIASALDYAHARGVLHRDVKPSNVLLARDGTPILSDFGLAKMVGSMPRLTQSGTTVGTPEYMAPEQALGAEVGPGADLYALAVVAYEMLTGRVPFTAETPLAVLLAHVHKPLPLPRTVNPSLSPGIEAVVLKGLAKTPPERYPTATELVRALAETGRSAAVAATTATALLPGPVAAPVSAPPRRLPVPRRRAWIAGAAALLLLIGGAAFLTSQREGPGPPLLARIESDRTEITASAPGSATDGTLVTLTYENNTGEWLTGLHVVVPKLAGLELGGTQMQDTAEGWRAELRELPPWSNATWQVHVSFSAPGSVPLYLIVRGQGIDEVRTDALQLTVRAGARSQPRRRRLPRSRRPISFSRQPG